MRFATPIGVALIALAVGTFAWFCVVINGQGWVIDSSGWLGTLGFLVALVVMLVAWGYIVVTGLGLIAEGRKR